ncbi:nuclear transport factor 2 family protein [Allobranchiibius sp. CTAmp26]|nr:nuclear transport factor 2 family protein [Allobranchiibius sp. CTAmp26]
MNDLMTTYLACWNETDPGARRALIEQHWTEQASYFDPIAQVRGRDAVDATIGAVQERFPEFVFTPAGPVDAHHQQARFTWGFGPADAEPVIVGFDVVMTDDDGRIASVLGFLDKVPA